MGANRLVQLLGQWADGSGPLYAQLAERLSASIDAGLIRVGERLPPERTLAEALSVSRGTIVRAYEEMAVAGSVRRVQGSGTTVLGNDLRADSVADQFVGERLWAPEAASVDLLKAIPTILPTVASLISSIDLTPHLADLDEAEPLGWWRLRERIAALHTRQGLATSPHQILVTSGAQQAISLAVSVFARPGDVVLGEDDTWPGLIDAVRHSGARFEQVAMDADGLIVDDLVTKIDRYRPSLMAFNPQHQNPTGSRLPPDRVAAVAELTRRHRILTIEDRVAADLGFDRRHLPAFDEFDTGGYGLIASSVCKVAWPGLRLGWLRADAQIINRLRTHKAVADMFTPSLSQLLGLEIVDRYEEIVGERLEQLRPSVDLLVDVVRRDLPEWSIAPVRGGLSVWIDLPSGASATAFVNHAARCGVSIASCREFCPNDVDGSHIRIPFTSPPDTLASGLERLVQAWKTFDRSPVEACLI
ncbi:MAG: PLP-dependent aminotransferase family protein [Ilumatobacter sp.]